VDGPAGSSAGVSEPGNTICPKHPGDLHTAGRRMPEDDFYVCPNCRIARRRRSVRARTAASKSAPLFTTAARLILQSVHGQLPALRESRYSRLSLLNLFCHKSRAGALSRRSPGCGELVQRRARAGWTRRLQLWQNIDGLFPVLEPWPDQSNKDQLSGMQYLDGRGPFQAAAVQSPRQRGLTCRSPTRLRISRFPWSIQSQAPRSSRM